MGSQSDVESELRLKSASQPAAGHRELVLGGTLAGASGQPMQAAGGVER